MRRARIKSDGAGYYHCMSRIIERRYVLGQAEKERFLDLMRKLANFSGLEVLAFCILDNHLHALLHVPERREVSDEELLQRLRHLYPAQEVGLVAAELQDFRSRGQTAAAEALKARFTLERAVRSRV